MASFYIVIKSLMEESRIQLSESWKRHLRSEFSEPYMVALREFLVQEMKEGKTIYPPPKQWFSALDLTSFEKVRVVILGQDPYHGPGQAHGLCFSVKRGVPLPPSLENIFRELRDDLGIKIPNHGCLESWAEQGVLLLNTVLTVEGRKAASHHGKGWEKFTDKIIQVLNERDEPIIFVLWGSPAQKKETMIDRKKHLILKAPHPSPLSAHRGFLGCKHFSQINKKLSEWNLPPITWELQEG